MASQADTKADAAAEQAYADAAGRVGAAKTADSVTAETPKANAETAAKTVETKAEPAAAKQAPRKAPAKKPAPAKKKAAASKAKAKAKAKPARKAPVKAKPAAAQTHPARKLAAKPASITPRITKPKDTIMATAKKTTKDFTSTAQNAVSELQGRTKAAYEKTQAYAGEMTEFSKGNLEALVESGKILGQGMQSMARSEAEAARGAFETVTADLKAFAAVKSPTELFKLQGEIARRNFDAAVAHYSKNAEVSMKLVNEAFAPLSTRMSLAGEKFSKAA